MFYFQTFQLVLHYQFTFFIKFEQAFKYHMNFVSDLSLSYLSSQLLYDCPELLWLAKSHRSWVNIMVIWSNFLELIHSHCFVRIVFQFLYFLETHWNQISIMFPSCWYIRIDLVHFISLKWQKLAELLYWFLEVSNIAVMLNFLVFYHSLYIFKRQHNSEEKRYLGRWSNLPQDHIWAQLSLVK